MYPLKSKIIVFYDTDCLFCTKSITIIDRLDKEKVIYFSSLNSSISKKHGLQRYCTEYNGTMVVLDTVTKKTFIASEAILKIASHNKFLKIIAEIAKIIPLNIRDAIYYLISNNRYSLSKKLNCVILPEELKQRILT